MRKSHLFGDVHPTTAAKRQVARRCDGFAAQSWRLLGARALANHQPSYRSGALPESRRREVSAEQARRNSSLEDNVKSTSFRVCPLRPVVVARWAWLCLGVEIALRPQSTSSSVQTRRMSLLRCSSKKSVGKLVDDKSVMPKTSPGLMPAYLTGDRVWGSPRGLGSGDAGPSSSSRLSWLREVALPAMSAEGIPYLRRQRLGCLRGGGTSRLPHTLRCTRFVAAKYFSNGRSVLRVDSMLLSLLRSRWRYLRDFQVTEDRWWA
ncbi:hypothetical protein B0T14DRAFT_132183 [Immersiella caudata]|uniref:Uncharacterized protein n=1 Tax=Immersiella caudata TaxID=314043 RepID=A0AA40C6R5_9PEZI|nr:hypothetical protein B0T14DRAFT_132183 [Immersiella caudata]